jgi:hypothetical protein
MTATSLIGKSCLWANNVHKIDKVREIMKKNIDEKILRKSVSIREV